MCTRAEILFQLCTVCPDSLNVQPVLSMSVADWMLCREDICGYIKAGHATVWVSLLDFIFISANQLVILYLETCLYEIHLIHLFTNPWSRS